MISSNKLTHRTPNPQVQTGIDLVVFDFFGTLFRGYAGGAEGTYEYRPGLKRLLELNPDTLVSLFTDAKRAEYETAIMKALSDMYVFDRFLQPFFYGDSLDRDGLKDLGALAREFGVNPNNIVLIGDGRRDYESARKYNSRLVLVPNLNYTNLPNDPQFELHQLGNLKGLLGDNQVVQIYIPSDRFDPNPDFNKGLKIIKGNYDSVESRAIKG